MISVFLLPEDEDFSSSEKQGVNMTTMLLSAAIFHSHFPALLHGKITKHSQCCLQTPRALFCLSPELITAAHHTPDVPSHTVVCPESSCIQRPHHSDGTSSPASRLPFTQLLLKTDCCKLQIVQLISPWRVQISLAASWQHRCVQCQPLSCTSGVPDQKGSETRVS